MRRSSLGLRTRRGPARFLPPLLWMGVIALGSSSLLSGGRTGQWMLAVLGALAPWASPSPPRRCSLRAAEGRAPRRVRRPRGPVVPRPGPVAARRHGGLRPRGGLRRAGRAPTGARPEPRARRGRRGRGLARRAARARGLDGAGAAQNGARCGSPPGRWRCSPVSPAGCRARLGARPAGADVGIAALGLGLVAAGLAWLARSRRSRGPATAPRPLSVDPDGLRPGGGRRAAGAARGPPQAGRSMRTTTSICGVCGNMSTGWTAVIR